MENPSKILRNPRKIVETAGRGPTVGHPVGQIQGAVAAERQEDEDVEGGEQKAEGLHEARVAAEDLGILHHASGA